MAGILTKGIKLGYKATSSESSYTFLTNLMEIPEIGNSAPEKVEVTVLEDDVKKYIAGLGDSGQDLTFKFLFEKAQFDTLSKLVESQDWEVQLPESIGAHFSGKPSVKFDSAAPNAALTYTLTVTVESKIDFVTVGA